jgi:serine/threonine protein kinase
MNSSLNANTLFDERYRILSRIGEGGYGTVYKARDQRQHGKLVAIKEINMSALSAQEKIEVTDTFNREIMLLSSLEHKSLPRIHDQFTDPEHWYIVMDYIEGETLEEVQARTPEGRLPTQQVIKIGTALCDVLSYLHNQDPAIIYRDVKPGNIMLTPWGQIYLIDFGIARRYQTGKLRDTGPLGSPGYAAPEQYGRAQTTPQTDIYGLGATLRTLLTGREPLEIHTQGLPPNIYIPWELQTLIMQMMDSDPDQRPESIADVKEALTPHLLTWRSLAVAPSLSAWIMIQGGFIASPFMAPCLWLALILMAAYCTYHVISAWRTTPTGRLSINAIILIIKSQLRNAFLSILMLTGGIALLYSFLTQPEGHYIYFLILAALYIGTIARFLSKWLKNRYAEHRARRSPAPQPQMLPPQQMQKRS